MRITFAVLLAAMCFICPAAFCGEDEPSSHISEKARPTPAAAMVLDAPSSSKKTMAEVALLQERKTKNNLVHKFWDQKNRELFLAIFAVRTADFISTKRFRRFGAHEALLNDAMVDNTPVFVGVNYGIGVGAHIGVCYLLHKTGHHKLERAASIIHITVSGVGATRNFMLP